MRRRRNPSRTKAKDGVHTLLLLGLVGGGLWVLTRSGGLFTAARTPAGALPAPSTSWWTQVSAAMAPGIGQAIAQTGQGIAAAIRGAITGQTASAEPWVGAYPDTATDAPWAWWGYD